MKIQYKDISHRDQDDNKHDWRLLQEITQNRNYFSDDIIYIGLLKIGLN